MNNNYLGISAIVFGTICFSVNDISVKLFSSEMPLNQLMFFRAIFAISILLFVILFFYRVFVVVVVVVVTTTNTTTICFNLVGLQSGCRNCCILFFFTPLLNII